MCEKCESCHKCDCHANKTVRIPPKIIRIAYKFLKTINLPYRMLFYVLTMKMIKKAKIKAYNKLSREERLFIHQLSLMMARTVQNAQNVSFRQLNEEE